jgi:uncharacterized UPF0160 family protein
MENKEFLEMQSKVNNYKTIYVHSGTFHSDDLLSVAFMKMLNPNISYKRIDKVTENILNEAKEGKALICDIGNIYDKENNLFDHHQENDDNLIAPRPSWEKNKQKIHYFSSFGLLWENFKDFYCEKEGKSDNFKKMFTDIIVRQIDACDNGVQIDDKIRKYKTNFPQIIKTLFIPTSIDNMSSTRITKQYEKNFDYAFKNALFYSEKYLNTHISNINSICSNQKLSDYDKTLIGYAKMRKTSFRTVQRELSRLLYTDIKDEESMLHKYTIDFVNFNQKINKIQSELTNVKNILYEKNNDIEVSKIIDLYKINKAYNFKTTHKSSTILQFPEKINDTLLKYYYKYPHSVNNTHTEIVHLNGNFQGKELNNKIDLLEEYSSNKKVNFFIYDISAPSTIFHTSFGYYKTLNDMFANGGILILKCSKKSEIKYDELNKLSNFFNSNTYYENRIQKNISDKLLVISNLSKEIESSFLKPSDDYEVQNTPIFYTYPERNATMLKINIPRLSYKTLTLNETEKVNPNLYICENQKDALKQAMTCLLTTKNYSDIKLGKNNNYALNSDITAFLSKSDVMKDSELIDKIIQKAEIYQLNTIKNTLEKYGEQHSDFYEKVKEKFEEYADTPVYEYLMQGYKLEFNKNSNTKYLINEEKTDIVSVEKLGYYDDFEDCEK